MNLTGCNAEHKKEIEAKPTWMTLSSLEETSSEESTFKALDHHSAILQRDEKALLNKCFAWPADGEVLPFIYNAPSYASYKPIFKKFEEQVKIVNFPGDKPYL